VDTSANGTALSPGSATILSAPNLTMVSVSGPVAATVAPAFASTVVAYGLAVVRSVTRPLEASAIRSARLMSAMTLPRPITTRWSARR
jgi:hypothetical protein